MVTPIWTMLVVMIATIIGAFGAIALKKSSSKFSLKLEFFLSKNFLLGLFFYGLSTIIYLVALKFGELSVLFPTLSTVYIWVSIFSQKYLKEKMNNFKWFGILVILLGVVFLAIGGQG